MTDRAEPGVTPLTDAVAAVINRWNDFTAAKGDRRNVAVGALGEAIAGLRRVVQATALKREDEVKDAEAS